MEMTKELLAKAKNAANAEELLTLAHENGMENFTEENAKAAFEQLHKSGELSDEELENASGGGSHCYGHLVVTAFHKCCDWRCEKCGAPYVWYSRIGQSTTYLCSKCEASAGCDNCQHSKYEKGLLLCQIH